MKKTYQKPAFTVVALHTEAAIMNLSGVKVDESNTISGDDAYSQKQEGAWNSELWSNE